MFVLCSMSWLLVELRDKNFKSIPTLSYQEVEVSGTKFKEYEPKIYNLLNF